jgi:hypothetical protein
MSFCEVPVFSFKKKSAQNISTKNGSVDQSEQAELKERLFFHDLINQTHGLILFLENKELQKSIINVDEVFLIKKEIKTLQSLIRDHYNFKHKNLYQTYDWMPFNYALEAFECLMSTYLANVEVSMKYSINNDSFDEDLIYYPCYYRILNNIIKNISEAGCVQVSITLTLDTSGLTIETSNQMHKSIDQNSPEYLTRVILDEKVRPIKSMGLDSIHHLAEENGGHFSFEIADSTWINRLFLPTRKPLPKIKTNQSAA